MRNRVLLVEMGGEQKTLNLKNSAEPEMFYFDPPYITDSVKITVQGVYQQCKNGGSINVYGTKCVATKNGMKIGPDGQPQSGPEEDCKKGGAVPPPKQPD